MTIFFGEGNKSILGVSDLEQKEENNVVPIESLFNLT